MACAVATRDRPRVAFASTTTGAVKRYERPERGRRGVDGNRQENEEPDEREAAHGTPVTMNLTLFEFATPLSHRLLPDSENVRGKFYKPRVSSQLPTSRFREGFGAG